MITINSNIGTVLSRLSERLARLNNPAELSRVVAVSMLPIVRERIHVEGKNSADAQIGEYTEEYMSVRTGRFKSNQTYSKGKSKGETKPTGTFTRGDRKGQPRPEYNRTDDRKVILSLKRQMENDLSVQASGTGHGLGYNNPANLDKANWNDVRYGTAIFKLTQAEKEKAFQIAQDYVSTIINE